MCENEDKIIYKDLSYKITGLVIDVCRKLGSGFLEKNQPSCKLKDFPANNARKA
jgi:hypothetical protein